MARKWECIMRQPSNFRISFIFLSRTWLWNGLNGVKSLSGSSSPLARQRRMKKLLLECVVAGSWWEKSGSWSFHFTNDDDAKNTVPGVRSLYWLFWTAQKWSIFFISAIKSRVSCLTRGLWIWVAWSSLAIAERTRSSMRCWGIRWFLGLQVISCVKILCCK